MSCNLRHLQSANPLVPPLHLQSSLLPVALVLDIRLENHLGLSRNVVDDHVKDGQIVACVLLDEDEHSAAESLEGFERRVEGHFEGEGFGGGTGAANCESQQRAVLNLGLTLRTGLTIFDHFGGQDVVPNPYKFAIDALKVGRE